MCVHYFYYEMGSKVGICKKCGAKDVSMDYGDLDDYIEANMLNFIMRRTPKPVKHISRQERLEKREKLLRTKYGEDIKTSRELGFDYTHSMYAYKEVMCPDCRVKRYVRIVKGQPESLYCRRCAQKFPKKKVKLANLQRIC